MRFDEEGKINLIVCPSGSLHVLARAGILLLVNRAHMVLTHSRLRSVSGFEP